MTTVTQQKTEETNTYSVIWNETVTYQRKVIASSEEDAIDIALSNYSYEDEIKTEGCDAIAEIVKSKN